MTQPLFCAAKWVTKMCSYMLDHRNCGIVVRQKRRSDGVTVLRQRHAHGYRDGGWGVGGFSVAIPPWGPGEGRGDVAILFLLVAKDTEVTACIKAVNFLHTSLQPKRIDVLVEFTNSPSFPQWCDSQLNNSSCTPQAFSHLTRSLQDTDGHQREFVVILHTSFSIAQRLERFSTSTPLTGKHANCLSHDHVRI